MTSEFIKSFNISQKSGVYLFKDSKGDVLYVGKAINLYNRVISYFRKDVSLKTKTMVLQIKEIETIEVDSELEALILEANLIKKYLPIFNVRLTDDKDYLYVGITKEEFPKVITLRKQDLSNVKKYFGPFPSSRTVKETLKKLRRIFPWCSSPLKGQIKNFRSCFYYHLGLCPGACAGQISKENYYKIINRFSKFLSGQKNELLEELEKEMRIYSQKQEFEEAAKYKKMIEGILYITQANRAQIYLENRNFLEQEREQSLETLQHDLNLKKIPQRIEAYDISNISGKDATGSMVVLTQGEIDKSQYRKFKIRMSGKPNDVGMHREMIKRRLNHPEWPIPDLIIVDGGKAQARVVNYELRTMNYELPIFGLAKRMEWLYPPQGEVVKLSKRSLSLRLLQKIRDESHRFALSYHRKLRSRSFLS